MVKTKNEILDEFQMFAIEQLREAAARHTEWSIEQQTMEMWNQVNQMPQLKKSFKGMVDCPECLSRGLVRVTVQDYLSHTETHEDLKCVCCKGLGKITLERSQQSKAEADMWCHCDKQEAGSFLMDGECNCGVNKHHVHCRNCKKILQIG